ncbi:hypothetical protein [Agrobacterium rosae]|uniref:hypothetical protein n=1 Tax=Agrobacterium rosae TaxID=1972867 RepID=UPI003BA305F3
MRRFIQIERVEFLGHKTCIPLIMNNDNADQRQHNTGMTSILDHTVRTKVLNHMRRKMQAGQRFSLSVEELADWIIQNGHAEDAMKRSGMNGIQGIDPSRPIAVDNIRYDAACAKRATNKCAGVAKVAQRKVIPVATMRTATTIVFSGSKSGSRNCAKIDPKHKYGDSI